MSDVNGSAPDRDPAEVAARAQFKLEEYVYELRALIQEEVDSRAEYVRLVEESKARERRLAKAVAALEGEPLGKPKTKPGPKPRAAQLISQEAADRVLEIMRELMQQTGGETVTRPQVVKAIPDMSGETVRRALILLRDQQLIRQAGREGKGGKTSAILYAVMPDAQD